ncbi:MAG: prolyl oligopeptidase family serine peptidase [Saprospiraceae bacterium]
MKFIFTFFTATIFVLTSAFGQLTSLSKPVNNSPLTITQFMQGERFVGFLPEDIRWSLDSKTIYFSWNPDGDTLRSDYKISLDDKGRAGEPLKVELEELKTLPETGDYNKARNALMYEKNGDIFLATLSASGQWESRQLTNTLDREGNPRFSGDEQQVIFQNGDNLFSWDLNSHELSQLTDFRSGKERGERPSPPHEAWLETENMELFEVLAERKQKGELRRERRKALAPDRPLTWRYGDANIGNLQVTPDLHFVTFRLYHDGDGKGTEVPNYVTESGQVEMLRSREKVGSPQGWTELGIYDRQRDTVYLVEVEQIEGIYDKPEFLREYHKDTTEYNPKYDKPRKVIFNGPVFSEDGKAVVVIRSLDNKDRWIMLLNLENGKLELIDRQRDEAWVGGPGISGWNFSTGTLGWLPDNKTLYFQSEESGFSHLYLYNVETKKKRQLTSGNFEILDVQLSNDGKLFYLRSNRESPFEQHLYSLPVAGGEMKKITSLPGNHETYLSPDERWIAVRYSYSNKPWELYLMPNEAGAKAVQLTRSTTKDFEAYPWREPELVWFEAADGVKVPARLYRPEAPKRNGAAVVFVHGAGYLQNVHRWWSSYYREYMFHNFLADNGYTVLDIDYRASSGYGRDWRTAIYRHMGGKDLSDQVDGARYLVAEHGIDADRIGIYGGSYGGFITLMAQFTAPGVFKSGAALRSVTDWAHYNHGYTSNILNTPVEDSIAYRRSSPIYFAEGLKGHLLILHGMVDVNVQFQDVVRLSQRLIELGKDNWEMAVFPMEDHGFIEPSSWADEYKRIYRLFDKTLRK